MGRTGLVGERDPKGLPPVYRVTQRLDAVTELIGNLVSWLTLAMVGVTFLVVLLRYVFDLGWIAMQEAVTYLHATVFMLGAAYALGRDAHVRIDIFYRRFGPRGRALTNLLGTLLLLLPTIGLIVWTGWGYVLESWRVTEGSPQASGLPGVFLLKSLILCMPLLMLLQAVVWVIRSLLVLIAREPFARDENGP